MILVIFDGLSVVFTYDDARIFLRISHREMTGRQPRRLGMSGRMVCFDIGRAM
jgi:hypothetical protein